MLPSTHLLLSQGMLLSSSGKSEMPLLCLTELTIGIQDSRRLFHLRVSLLAGPRRHEARSQGEDDRRGLAIQVSWQESLRFPGAS